MEGVCDDRENRRRQRIPCTSAVFGLTLSSFLSLFRPLYSTKEEKKKEKKKRKERKKRRKGRVGGLGVVNEDGKEKRSAIPYRDLDVSLSTPTTDYY